MNLPQHVRALVLALIAFGAISATVTAFIAGSPWGALDWERYGAVYYLPPQPTTPPHGSVPPGPPITRTRAPRPSVVPARTPKPTSSRPPGTPPGLARTATGTVAPTASATGVATHTPVWTATIGVPTAVPTRPGRR